MTKLSQDPRNTKCGVNQWGKHKWARASKDTISKTQFIQILRCRYCAHFMGAEFNRTILPSGRVIITERVFAIEPAEDSGEVTVKLHKDESIDEAMKRIVNTAHMALR